jgi:hypothetical protein
MKGHFQAFEITIMIMRMQKADDVPDYRMDPRAAVREQPGISLPPPQRETFRQWSDAAQNDAEWPPSIRSQVS